MNWILGKIVGNPLLILWIAAAGGVAGGAAWTAQGWRLMRYNPSSMASWRP
ncbi:MAG: hypothetical protein IPM06_21550 [Rhizobiales bacterium]|nr:hypothetical protein [Hyphomicrobiales bacterium]